MHARANRIIEIAGQRFESGLEPIWFSQLINPGVSIPHRITRITGITTAMVFDQPKADEVMPAFEEFLGDAVFVAHNIKFDVGFVNAEFERVGLPPMSNKGLCTLRLARRLLPGLRSKSLGSLAKFYRIPGEGRHRAAKDVEITSIVLDRLCQIAADEHGVSSLAELIELQGRTYQRINHYASHVVAIKRDRLPELPSTPGVYYMRDGRGKVLYVGKAKNLSKRVTSYFRAIEAHPPRLRQLITKVRDVTWQEWPTELHALIEESREIKRLDPSFNRAQKKYVPRPYLRLDSREDFPRITVQVILRDDGAEYFGPFRSRKRAQTLVDLIERFYPMRNCSTTEFQGGRRCVRADIGRCGAPCEGEMPKEAYTEVVDAVRRFLHGDVEEVSLQLEEAMLEASEAMRFEEAAQLRDWITFLDDRLSGGGAIADPVDGPTTVHYKQGQDDEHDTLVVLSGGRITSLESLDGAFATPQDLSDLVTASLAACENGQMSALDRQVIDARRMVDHWTHVHRDIILSAEQRPDESAEAFAERILALIALHQDVANQDVAITSERDSDESITSAE